MRHRRQLKFMEGCSEGDFYSEEKLTYGNTRANSEKERRRRRQIHNKIKMKGLINIQGRKNDSYLRKETKQNYKPHVVYLESE